MSEIPSTDEIKSDLKAALATRQELGPEYDDHVLQSFAEAVTRQLQQAQAQQKPTKAQTHGLSNEQRTGLAICSLIFGIPLTAISLALAGLTGFGLVVLLILGVNFAATR
jgi:hypothetical protein